MIRYWYYGHEEDKALLQKVMLKYGCQNESQCIRLLVRLANEPDALKVSMPSKDSKVVKKVKKSLLNES